MDWDIIAPMVVSIVFFLVTGGVILLRPLSKRLGDLLEAMTEERQTLPDLETDLSRIRDAMESMESRMRLLEERQDFAEQLLGRGEERKRVREGEEE